MSIEPGVLLLLTIASVLAKPTARSLDESTNEIDHGASGEYKDSSTEATEDDQLATLPRDEESILASEDLRSTTEIAPATTSLASNDKSDSKGGPLGWLLGPLAQRVQFSAQSLFQERLAQLRGALNNLTASSPLANGAGKQLNPPGGLLHLVGLNDPGFYTNRLEPAGFLGGNGWFANKGGILGGPGALVSTGSLLTDYPTAYKK